MTEKDRADMMYWCFVDKGFSHREAAERADRIAHYLHSKRLSIYGKMGDAFMQREFWEPLGYRASVPAG